ncbi:MAG TPA: hypothetical protein VIR31_01720, partial [Nitrososphaeraceae archaeon]
YSYQEKTREFTKDLIIIDSFKESWDQRDFGISTTAFANSGISYIIKEFFMYYAYLYFLETLCSFSKMDS